MGMRSPLEDALNLGNLVILQSVAKVATDERIKPLTVLDMAAMNTRRDEFVPIFLDSLTCENGDYWTKESVEVTALIAGVISGSERVVERLIRDGADTNISTELGSPLFSAAAISTVAIVQLLINSGAQVMPSELEGREHSSPLLIAAALGNIDIVELLLKSGADVERGTAIIFHSMLD
ncbi:hypothetical protein EAF00_008173 [Botryotinia globosa]|nr:hypothetical protein EAF00_008173 [Botryotinia globosa]